MTKDKDDENPTDIFSVDDDSTAHGFSMDSNTKVQEKHQESKEKTQETKENPTDIFLLDDDTTGMGYDFTDSNNSIDQTQATININADIKTGNDNTEATNLFEGESDLTLDTIHFDPSDDTTKVIKPVKPSSLRKKDNTTDMFDVSGEQHTEFVKRDLPKENTTNLFDTSEDITQHGYSIDDEPEISSEVYDKAISRDKPGKKNTGSFFSRKRKIRLNKLDKISITLWIISIILLSLQNRFTDFNFNWDF